MLSKIIKLSLRNKFVILLFTLFVVVFGLFSLSRISIGAVPDVTNNQVQVITTSTHLSTQDMEQFITYPIELEMANLPNVQEIRSVSKFGLSVVTIVFDDDIGTFLPRQLIAEKIKSASETIPEGFGTPEMGPISTGLGEIYQYILDVEDKYKDQYSPQDLRTIQDWIVKRQLSGIPGVVEVNSWGGFLKQYEVALNTNKLQAMNITAQHVFTALELNNSIAGGGYIEKKDQAYFIRGEGMVKSIEDIENIVVKTNDGIPIYVKDVAQVAYGNATRYGAITGNAEGEKVLGQVMMLKGANSKEVIESVKDKVASISKSLPKGVSINAFLDRSELIDKTTSTITENLILGCLIVVFVVVLLLGNWRSGVVIASIIPLSLLFALSLMYLFDVDANLMSLGAIDFGIIIDGAVIIVEFIAFKITKGQKEFALLDRNERQPLKDKITYNGASKMMNSAIFGQLIILIVLIPVLSLSGIEGKMFRPMALTFSFALIGAMILCFTYVPVVASLVLKPSNASKKNIAVVIMNLCNKWYEPVINWALNRKRMVLGLAGIMLISAIYIFAKLGGEFVPTLDEGDFVIQPVLKTGTSLTRTTEITTEIESILLQNFPEVKQVVTRIGAAEVPTDPMSMEETDIIIILKPKKEWTSASTKDELAERFKEALAIIPETEIEFTQPIEMRFNELITGVRADIAIKVFGEDLKVLAKKGSEIKALIEDVPGAADITVEKIDGLPQMNVKYNRSKIARYGLNIKDINDVLSMGFAGKTVGQVFEGEKRFDLVVRLDESKRSDIQDIENLLIDLPKGGKIPLTELATISYQKGAAKISRDNTRRRIVVGINVRNRDLESVVSDVQELISENINLPVGYTIDYGGQFENLQKAKSRLMVAVPIALFLIFVMLYFALNSIKDTLLIYSAIPLSAVGGVMLLWLRDMPFSISAGVGFIALFGVAVLNGIVLIEHYKELKQKEFESIDALIKKGTKDRLRAVLLTASSTALGFLPMAISSSAGAEVQRPLATVVIGGLITATILTLIVLPVLYSIFNNLNAKTMKIRPHKTMLIVLSLALTSNVFSQQESNDLNDLIAMAINNNKGLKAKKLKIDQSEKLVGTAFDFDKTEVYYSYDENNLALNERPIGVIGIQQDFNFPTQYFAAKKLNNRKLELETSNYTIEEKALEREVVSSFYTLVYTREKARLYQKLDSLYERFSEMATRRFELGETNYLERLTARSKQKQVRLDLLEAQQDLEIAYNALLVIVQSNDTLIIENRPLDKAMLIELDLNSTPEVQLYQSRQEFFKAKRRLEKQKLLPDLSLNYFQGSNSGISTNLIGYQFGLRIPILFNAQSARIKSAKIEELIAEEELHQFNIELHAEHQKLNALLVQQGLALEYYENEGKDLAKQIFKTSNSSFQNGEIDFYQFILSTEDAYEIQINRLEKLNNYNQTVIKLNYLTL